MLKTTILPDKLVSNKNNDNKLVSRKNNGNNKIEEFNISNNSIKYIKKSKNYLSQKNQKVKKCSSLKIWLS